jgi:hypothetical protein
MTKRWLIGELKKRIADGETLTLKKSIITHSYNGRFNGAGEYDDKVLSIRRNGNTFFCNTTKHNGNDRELLKFQLHVVYGAVWQLLSEEQRMKLALRHLYESSYWCGLENYT